MKANGPGPPGHGSAILQKKGLSPAFFPCSRSLSASMQKERRQRSRPQRRVSVFSWRPLYWQCVYSSVPARVSTTVPDPPSSLRTTRFGSMDTMGQAESGQGLPGFVFHAVDNGEGPVADLKIPHEREPISHCFGRHRRLFLLFGLNFALKKTDWPPTGSCPGQSHRHRFRWHRACAFGPTTSAANGVRFSDTAPLRPDFGAFAFGARN